MHQTKLGYSKKQAAAETSLSVRTLEYLIQSGQLKARKIGRRVVISGRELTRLLESGVNSKHAQRTENT